MEKKIILISSILIIWTGIFSLLFFSFQKKENDGFDLNVNSSFVQNLYEMAVPNKNEYMLRQLYGNTEFTNEYKLNLGIMNLSKKTSNKDEILLSSQVEESVKEILGENATVNHQDLKFWINGHCGYYYNETNESYEPFNGCGGIPFEYFYRNLLKAEEREEQIILTEQSFYVYIDRAKSGAIYVYNNYQQDKLLDYIEPDIGVVYEVKEEDYIKEGSIYEYVFRKENNKYIFESLNKIES